MTTSKRNKITANINSNKELLKSINNTFTHSDDPIERFIDFAERWANGIKDNRIICSIGSVSSSGMSRTVKFLECKKNSKGYYEPYSWLTFYSLFITLGYKETNQRNGYFRIHGCGMDMIFHTNYTIIHELHRLGFINKKQCDTLAQSTPNTI